MRTGLSMNVSGLKKLDIQQSLCTLYLQLLKSSDTFFAPHFLGTTKLEALIIGAVLAAVSPAVIVPRKIRLTEEGYGTKKQIPQMILAGASVDDVFVIVIFSTFFSMAQGKEIDAIKIASIPFSILFGIFGVFFRTCLGILLQKKSHQGLCKSPYSPKRCIYA